VDGRALAVVSSGGAAQCPACHAERHRKPSVYSLSPRAIEPGTTGGTTEKSDEIRNQRGGVRNGRVICRRGTALCASGRIRRWAWLRPRGTPPPPLGPRLRPR